MTKKCPPNLPKGSQNRAQDAQDAAKMASWSPHGRQNASQDGPKTPKKVMFFSFFSGFWCQMPPSAPQDAQDSEIWSKKSPQDPPDLLWTLISIQFWTISYEILKDFSSSFASLCSPLLCFALRCFTGSTTNHPHYQNNASTRQPHLRNDFSLPARWRVMRSTWDIFLRIMA